MFGCDKVNKYIYSYELDSICNNENEITNALDKVLYETIMLNGDKIVLTFNQLADSKIFMSFLKDIEMKNILVELFRQHKIVISRYTDKNGEMISTAVQYVKKKISKLSQSSNSNFIFSSIDILNNIEEKEKNMIFDFVTYSLSFCDIDYLARNLKSMKLLSNEDIDIIANYVDFLIRISITDIEYLPPKQCVEKYSFIDCVKIAINSLKLHGRFNVANELEKIYNYVSANKPNLKQNRSNWIDCIGERNQLAEEIETVLDVCYNLAVEASISFIDSIENVDDRMDYFFYKLKSTEEFYKKNGHSFSCDASNRQTPSLLYDFSFLQREYWSSVVRIMDEVEKDVTNIDNWKKVIKKKKNRLNFFFGVTFLGTAGILCGFNVISDLIFDIINDVISLSVGKFAILVSFALSGLAVYSGDFFGYKLKIENLAELRHDKKRQIDRRNCTNAIKNKFYNKEVI